MSLPTIKECQVFHQLVNAGRIASNRKPVTFLNFDDATPADPLYCLSALNLFVTDTDKHSVGSSHVDTKKSIAKALNLKRINEEYKIPKAILTVTDAFDNEIPGLRERMVAAGVVKP